jgi:hypothetical protein
MKTSYTTADSKMNNQNTNTLVQENEAINNTNKRVFSTVDLWNIQRMKRVRTPRKLLS